jgi:hypothetical protein
MIEINWRKPRARAPRLVWYFEVGGLLVRRQQPPLQRCSPLALHTALWRCRFLVTAAPLVPVCI